MITADLETTVKERAARFAARRGEPVVTPVPDYVEEGFEPAQPQEEEVTPGPEPEPEPEPPAVERETPEFPSLKSLVLERVESMGVEGAADYFNKSVSLVRKWRNGDREPTLDAAEKVLAERPDHHPLAKLNTNPDWGTVAVETLRPKLPVMACVATAGRPPSWIIWAQSLMLSQKYQINWAFQPQTILTRARNFLAETFLRSENEWCWFIDDDIVLPTGDGNVFGPMCLPTRLRPEQVGQDALARLLSHHQPLVGALYATRSKNGPLCAQPDLNPRHPGDLQLSEGLRNNQVRGLVPVDWIATGCMLIHRRVFEAIRDKYPDLAPKAPKDPFGFFDQIGQMGEDVSFCARARECGFQPLLDAELVVGHVGMQVFLPENSQGPTR